VEHRTRLRQILPWVVATAILCIIVAGAAVWKLKPIEAHQVTRFVYDLPEGQQFSYLSFPALAVSPDGRQLVYSTTNGLYLRSMDELTARLITGTEGGPQQPFFSPDGKWIGYFSVADRQLKKIAVNGGTPIALCKMSQLLGASWSADNTIVYGDTSGVIMRISPDGRTLGTLLKRKSEEYLSFPQTLPDGRSVLSTLGLREPFKIMVKLLGSGELKELFVGCTARYLTTGHVVYAVGNNLYAARFDPDGLNVADEPVPVVEGVHRGFAPQYAISDSGTLAYIPGSTEAATIGRTLVWVNREGKEEPLSAPPNDYACPTISPDGTKVVLTIRTGGNEDVWIWDLVRETMSRLTFGEAEDSWPLWTPDGRRIVYRSDRGNRNFDLNMKTADGSGEVEKLVSWPNFPAPFCWSKDGKTLLSWDYTPSTVQTGISMLSLEGDHTRVPLLEGKFNYDHPQISPDGRWLAYASNESGQNEVYVRPFPDVNKGRWQISTKGGNGPLWSPDGRELFYRDGESVMAVSVETEPIFKPGKIKLLFRGAYFSARVGQAVLPMWDISPDGKRFLMMKDLAPTGSASGRPRRINIVLNWLEELKQRVPVK
jgi:Tol biopolymer transport system component